MALFALFTRDDNEQMLEETRRLMLFLAHPPLISLARAQFLTPACEQEIHVPRWRGIQGVDNEREVEMKDSDIRQVAEGRDLPTHGNVRAIRPNEQKRKSLISRIIRD